MKKTPNMSDMTQVLQKHTLWSLNFKKYKNYMISVPQYFFN